MLAACCWLPCCLLLRIAVCCLLLLPAGWFEALETALTKDTGVRSKEALIDWCETAKAVNQREGVGIARVILGATQVSGSAAHRLTIAFMKLVKRTGDSAWLTEIKETMFGEHDAALEIAWLDMRKDAGTVTRFVNEYSDIIHLVLGKTTLDKIMGETMTWTNVSAELEEVTGSTLVGKRLFQHAMYEVAHSTYSQVLA